MSELITIKTLEVEEVFTNRSKLDEILEQIKSKTMGIAVSVEKAKDRDEIRSIAAKIAKSKTYLDDLAKERVAELKEIPKLIDANRKHMRDFLDDLKEEVRKPLTDFENAEKERVEVIKSKIQEMVSLGTITFSLSALELKERIKKLEKVQIDNSFCEFLEEAEKTKTHSLEVLESHFKAAEHREKEAKELEEARAKLAEQERIQREERIAREAAEKAEREKLEAERKALEAERREIEAKAEKARLEIENARLQEEANKRAEQAAEAARLKAIEQERERQKKQAEEEQKALRVRQENIQHAKKIHNAIVQSLVDLGIEKDLAMMAVRAIAKKEIQHVQINY